MAGFLVADGNHHNAIRVSAPCGGGSSRFDPGDPRKRLSIEIDMAITTS
jgi:hypothetical protein